MFRIYFVTREGGTYSPNDEADSDFKTRAEAEDAIHDVVYDYYPHYIGDELIVDGFVEDLS